MIEQIGDIAAHYIEAHGFGIVALGERSKEPATTGGLNDWSDDPDSVRAWLHENPECNIAVACGQPSGGVVVIDIDKDDDYDAFEFLRDWEIAYGDLPETVSAITGRGGLHLYYRVDREIRQFVNDELHIDFRGDGSYAMLPPSVHPNGNTVEWENDPDDFDIAEADERVYRFIEWVRPESEGGGKFELPDVIELGERDRTLMKYGFSMLARSVDPELLRATLHKANEERCSPPLAQRQVDKIARSVLKKKPGYSDEVKAMLAESEGSDEPDDPGEADKPAPKKSCKRAAFDHSRFGDKMIVEDHVCLIDEALAVYKDNCYKLGNRAVQGAMIRRKRNIKHRERTEVLRYLEIEAPVKELADKRYIAFKNGVLDLETMTLSEMSPALIIPNIIPHNWNPEADDPIVANTFMKMACGDSGTYQNLFEIIGHSMYRGAEIPACPILFGTGQNGKSTYLNMLHNILGDANVSSLDIATIGERFQSVAIMGKLANIGDDISNEFVSGSKASVVKKVATHDWIQAEYKGGDTFQFRPYCTPIFSCNEFPRIGDSSQGVMRRLFPVKFAARFKTSDPDFDPYIEDKLSTESACETAIYAGILALKMALERKEFTQTAAYVEEIENIKLTNSTVYQFAIDVLGYGTDEPDSVINQPTSSVYEEYMSYCSAMKIKTPVHQPRFSTEIKTIYDCEIGLKRIETTKGKKRVRCFTPKLDK